MYFDNRADAARQLADALRKYEGMHPVVLAIPRGAVPMGRIVAHSLGGDLDVVLVRKLRAPNSAEGAVGSVDENGRTYIDDYVRDMGVGGVYLEAEKRAQLQLLRQQRRIYTPSSSALDARGRVAIVIDDGLATGFTMMAALHAVRLAEPAMLVCAVPVASHEALTRIRGLAGEMVCLSAPVEFGGVARFYRSFQEVTDTEVARILRAAREPELIAS
jgi:predicted phosphoribosyltransferase